MAANNEPELALRQEASELVLVPVPTELLATQLCEGKDLAAGIVRRVPESVESSADTFGAENQLRPLRIEEDLLASSEATAPKAHLGEGLAHSQIEYEVEMYSAEAGSEPLGSVPRAAAGRARGHSKAAHAMHRSPLRAQPSSKLNSKSTAGAQVSSRSVAPARGEHSTSVPDRLIGFLAGLLKRLERRILAALKPPKRLRTQTPNAPLQRPRSLLDRLLKRKKQAPSVASNSARGEQIEAQSLAPLRSSRWKKRRSIRAAPGYGSRQR